MQMLLDYRTLINNGREFTHTRAPELQSGPSPLILLSLGQVLKPPCGFIPHSIKHVKRANPLEMKCTPFNSRLFCSVSSVPSTPFLKAGILFHVLLLPSTDPSALSHVKGGSEKSTGRWKLQNPESHQDREPSTPTPGPACLQEPLASLSPHRWEDRSPLWGDGA